MTRTSATKLASVMLISLALSACAGSRLRFPDYNETVKSQPTISTVVDVFMYRDIKGDEYGYNEQVNKKAIEEALNQLDVFFRERGFQVQSLASLNGLSYERKQEKGYVVSEDWESTGVKYPELALNRPELPWLTSENRDFLISLKQTAREINARRKRDQKYAESIVLEKAAAEGIENKLPFSKLVFDDLLLSESESDIVLFVLVEGRYQKLGKYLSTGAATTLAASALTGGLFLTAPPGSYTQVDVVAFNKNTKNILWHGKAVGEGRKAISNGIKKAMHEYPYSNGDSPRQREAKRLKKLVKEQS